jgi:hypothetical protein
LAANHLIQSCISDPRRSGVVGDDNCLKPLYLRRVTSNADKTFMHVLEVTQQILLRTAKTKVLQQRCLGHVKTVMELLRYVIIDLKHVDLMWSLFLIGHLYWRGIKQGWKLKPDAKTTHVTIAFGLCAQNIETILGSIVNVTIGRVSVTT